MRKNGEGRENVLMSQSTKSFKIHPSALGKSRRR